MSEALKDLETLKQKNEKMEADYQEAKEDFRASCKLISKIDEEQVSKDEIIQNANERIWQLEEEIEKEKLQNEVILCKEREKYENIISKLSKEKKNLKRKIEEITEKTQERKIEKSPLNEKHDTPSISPNLNNDIQRLAEKSQDKINFDWISYSNLDLRERIKDFSKSREEETSDDDEGSSPFFDENEEDSSLNLRTCNMSKVKNFGAEIEYNGSKSQSRNLKRDFSAMTMGFNVENDQKTVKILNKNASYSNVTLNQKFSNRNFDCIRTPSGKKLMDNLVRSDKKKNILSFGKTSCFRNERKYYDSANNRNYGNSENKENIQDSVKFKRKTIEFNLHTEESEKRKNELERVKVLRSCQKSQEDVKSNDEILQDNRAERGCCGCGNQRVQLKCCLI